MPKPSSLRAIATLLWKDLRVEVREKTNLWVQAGFTLAAGVLVASGASGAVNPADAGATSLSLVVLFLALFTGYSVFLREAYQGSLDGLRAAPVERWTIIMAKTLFALILLYPQILLFTVILDAFTFGLDPAWPPLLAWAAATSLFLAAITSFSSASLAFGEARSGPLVMVMLVLSIPYLRIAITHLATILSGVYPPPGALLGLAAMAWAFTGLALFLGNYILE